VGSGCTTSSWSVELGVIFRAPFPAQHPPRLELHRCAADEDRLAVHPDALDARRERMRIARRRAVDHRGRIEEHEIGIGARHEAAALLDSDVIGGEGGHLAHGLFERQHAALARSGRANAACGCSD
jgi:hypothetical protein